MANENLSPEQIEFFTREGYILLPGLIEREYRSRLVSEVDAMMGHREDGDNRLIVSYREMGLLTSHPPAMAMLEQLMDGPRFSMHHIHATRHAAGDGGVGWHQDYEQYPQTNRSHLMVHVFYYLSGLTGEIGDLLLVPQSQKLIAQRDLRILGTADLPESLCVDDLEPGSAVIVHSALWHARRPKPGGENASRYFIDISYCQHGSLWPGYGRDGEINALALEMGCDREGRYAFLYDESHFFDAGVNRKAFDEVNEGSLVYRLLTRDGPL